MAPEMIRGKPEKASDQYALGIVVYEWLSGTPPFTEGDIYQLGMQHLVEPVPPLRDILPTLSPRVEEVVLKALAKQPADRFPSVLAFAEALEEASQAPPPGTRLLLYRGHSSPVWTLAWSPDGSRIASGSDDQTVQVWDVSSGRILHTYSGHFLRTYRGHSSNMMTLAWSSDGSRIASGSLDHTVQVWDVSSGRILHTYRGHSDAVWTLAWSPDGTRIASGSRDQTVQVWQAE